MYFEEARAAYWRDVAGKPGLDDIDYVLAEAQIRYRQRVLYPGMLAVSMGVSEIGKKHFRMRYEVRAEGGDLLITGETVQVMYDYEARTSTRISDDVRARIIDFDGPFA